MVGRCRSGSVSRILSTPEGAGWPFFSRPYGHAPQNGVQLLPGVIAGRRPFPCLSCIARGLPCLPCCLGSGGLLPHLFTLTLAGGLFSVALAVPPPLRAGSPPFQRARCLVMSGLSSTGFLPQRPPEPERRAEHTSFCRESKAKISCHSTSAMMAMPRITPLMAKWCCPQRSAMGNSSSKAM